MPADQKSNAAPWLSIVGIGEDGLEGMGSEAKRRVANAAFVFGGKRHLALVSEIITGDGTALADTFRH